MTDSAPLDHAARRSVFALLTSVLCTSTAALAGVTALGKQVYDLTDRELDLGLLGLAEFAPAALLVLVTGTVADRYERRRVVALGAGAEAIAAVGLAWYATTNPTAAAPIFGLVVVFGIARAFVAPAARAIPADIVPAARLPWLIARFSVTWQVALITGPVLGGFLYAAAPAAAYGAMALLLAIGSGVILLIPARSTGRSDAVAPTAAAVDRAMQAAIGEAILEEGERPVGSVEAKGGLSEALEGLRFIRGHPVVLGAISLDLFAVLFGGAVALLPAIAQDRLGVGAVGLGWLRAAGGIGAALVTGWLAFRPVRRRVGRVLLASVGVFGIGTLALGVTSSYAVAFLAMAVLSGADAISVFIRATLVPLVTPEDRRGRVLAVENVFIGASNELGAFESGVAGQLIGASGAVVLGGAATLVVAGVWGFVFPALRDIDTFPSPEVSPGS